MPRGNDTAYAQEFNAAAMNQYGIHSNAEEMIQDHRSRQDPALQRASLVQVNADATEEAMGDLDGVGKKFDLGDGETVLSATVRGNALIAVIEDERGFTRKEVTGWNDSYVTPKLAPHEVAARAQWERDAQIRQETAKLRAEADAKIAEAAAKENERVAEAIAKLSEQADKELAKATEKAEKEAAKEQGKQSGSGGGGGSTKQSGGKPTDENAGTEKSAAKSTQTPSDKAGETKQQ